MTQPALPSDYAGPPTVFAPPAAPPAPAAPPVAAAPPAPPAAAPAAPAPAPVAAPVVHGRGGPMDEEAISERVKREKRKQLKELYGTDDEEQIAAIKAQRAKDAEDLAALRANKEKAEREQMSEVQRLTADLDAANKTIADLQAKLAGKEREVMSSKQDALITSKLATHKFVAKPSIQKAIKVALSDHYNSLTKAAQAIFVKTGGLDKWLRDFAKENPEFVQATPAATTPTVTTTTTAPAAAPKPPVRVPAGGPKPPVPPRAAANTAAPDPLEGKTPLPGRPNSMTKAELDLYMKRGRSN